MTLNCENINLKKGSKGNLVKELQGILKNKKYYNGRIDGDYGTMTVDAVKKLQKELGVKVDGFFGPVTCRAYEASKTTTTVKKSTSGVYVSTPHWTSSGCGKLGQKTAYTCGPHSIFQNDAKMNIDSISENTIASWAGTTTAGTGHQGLETALQMVAQKTGQKISVEWKNFSDLGKTINERFKALGEIIEQPNKGVIVHNLYRNKYGHYEVIREINTNNNTCKVLNSLGNRCGYPCYCGYIETRSFSTFASYIGGISQKSIMILTYQ